MQTGKKHKANAFGEQDENGVDLEMLRYNRSLSFEARAERLRRSALSLMELQRARAAARHPRTS